MKVYFIASPRAIKDYGEVYKKIYQVLKDLGCTHVNDFVISVDVEKFYAASYEEREEHYKRTADSIKRCDVVVVEASIHSLAIGHIVDRALILEKPTIVLYLEDCEPYFLSGAQDDKLQIWEYKPNDIKRILRQALGTAKENMDVRFTLLLPPKIVAFLNKVSKKKKIPRSVFIRSLIEKEMEKEK